MCQDVEKNVVTKCGHRFCSNCLSTWLETCRRDHREKTCPECRTTVDGFTKCYN